PFQFNNAKFKSVIYIYNLSKFSAIYRYTIIKERVVTMYIKNRQNSNKIKGFGSYQNLSLTDNICLEIAYFSYTNRWRYCCQKTSKK
ncbi:MAG: hypothetical protein KDE33_20795, partial [Bacteroidetes bacterium]|nr:hypothetical protein [Bacteroidota bacterium]